MPQTTSVSAIITSFLKSTALSGVLVACRVCVGVSGRDRETRVRWALSPFCPLLSILSFCFPRAAGLARRNGPRGDLFEVEVGELLHISIHQVEFFQCATVCASYYVLVFVNRSCKRTFCEMLIKTSTCSHLPTCIRVLDFYDSFFKVFLMAVTGRIDYIFKAEFKVQSCIGTAFTKFSLYEIA